MHETEVFFLYLINLFFTEVEVISLFHFADIP